MKRISRNSKFVLFVCLFISIACGGYYNYEIYSIFYPETTERPISHERYFFTFFYPYGENSRYGETEENDKAANIAAWHKYLGKKVSKKELKTELYSSTALSSGFKLKISTSVKKGALDYLESAKAINLLTEKIETGYWDKNESANNHEKIKSLVKQIENNLMNEEDVFLKERYLYLLIKTSALLKDYKSVVNYYEQYRPKILKPTFISEWSQSHYAGSFYHLRQLDRSFYEFSRVFAYCPSRKAAADMSVKDFSIPFSKTVLTYCKSDKEKANAYVLNGMQNFSDIVVAAEKTCDFNPNHTFLPLLISRAINQQEHYFFRAKNDIYLLEDDKNSKKQKKQKIAKAPSELHKIKNLIINILNSSSSSNKDFYHLALAYINLLEKNLDDAKISLDAVHNENNNKYISKQYKVLNITLNLLSDAPYDENIFMNILDDIQYLSNDLKSARDVSVMQHISKNLEQYFFRLAKKEEIFNDTLNTSWIGCTEMKDNKHASIHLARIFFAKSLSSISEKWKGSYKTFRLGGYKLNEYLDTSSKENLAIVSCFFQTENLSPLDKKLQEISAVSKNNLNLRYSRKLVLNHEFDKASTALASIDKAFLDSVIQITKVRSTPKLWLKSEKLKKIKDPVRYIKEIDSLKKSLQINPEDAKAHFKYAEALINISYHGKAWFLSHSYRSVSEPKYWDNDSRKYKFTLSQTLMKNYYGLELALVHIEKALKYSKDKELSSKVAFLGAFAEKGAAFWHFHRNAPLNDWDKLALYEKDNANLVDRKFRKYFHKLKHQYKKARYTKMIIKECDEFAQYIAK
jgi:hypothetical protein